MVPIVSFQLHLLRQRFVVHCLELLPASTLAGRSLVKCCASLLFLNKAFSLILRAVHEAEAEREGDTERETDTDTERLAKKN